MPVSFQLRVWVLYDEGSGVVLAVTQDRVKAETIGIQLWNEVHPEDRLVWNGTVLNRYAISRWVNTPYRLVDFEVV